MKFILLNPKSFGLLGNFVFTGQTIWFELQNLLTRQFNSLTKRNSFNKKEIREIIAGWSLSELGLIRQVYLQM